MADCTCDKCVRACSNTPGWFRPGEMERAAKFLKLTPRQFFRKYCGVNWLGSGTREVFVLAPAITHMDAGGEYPGNPRGVCVFLKDSRCAIHAVKPHECRKFRICDGETDKWDKDRTRTVALWRKEQGQITKLLKRKPRAEMLSFLDLFSSMLGL